MASLGTKNGIFVARFRHEGREYKKSLKTDNRKDADAAMLRVKDALHRLAIRVIRVPEGVDPGDYILSGGTLTAPAPKSNRVVVPSFEAAIREYQGNLGHLAESSQSTVRGHLRTLQKKLGAKADAPLNQIEQRELDSFVQSRLRERSSTTVSKERVTLVQFFDWLVSAGYLPASPAANLSKVKAAGDLPPFRTYQELEAAVNRGGLSPRQILALWDCLYLTPAEIAELLTTVRERSREDVSLILHAIAAYTGMRRGEILRLSWTDIEFDQDSIIARSLKQSRQVIETRRRIDMHPELKAVLLEWRDKRPRGQLVVCDPETLAALTSRQTTGRFTQPLRGTKWCLSSRRDWFKIGFHTFRHSFASNLAAAGVDQRIIDEWMGHQTEAMRKRYRHLFPKDRRSAIESFSLAAPPKAPATEPPATESTAT